jgi:nucleotide-binding universal stress UspA family protein
MKMLVAVDGSAASLQALDSLARHLAWYREPPQITLVYVHLALPYKRAVAWAGHEAVQRYYDEESAAALAPARAFLDGRSIAYAVEQRVGDPAHEIVTCAAAGGYDLIALGTHGHSALANVVLGSVATRVLALARQPVLLLK